MRRETLVDRVMAERINYGGVCGTRAQVYEHARGVCLSRLPSSEPDRKRSASQAADRFAFGPQATALSDEDCASLISWESFLGLEDGNDA